MPTNGFGRDHLDVFMATYFRIQRMVFQRGCENDEDGSIPIERSVDHIKTLFKRQYDIADVSDAYLFFPVELGGLELNSPMDWLIKLLDATSKSPSALLDEFLAAELKEYRRPKAAQREEFLQHNPFFSFEEYTRWREEVHYGFDNDLVDVYKELLIPPLFMSSLYDKSGLKDYLRTHDYDGGMWTFYLSKRQDIGPYWKDIIERYGDEFMEKFGGLELVDVKLLPSSTLDLMKERKADEGY
ncbi:hypothetical protein PG997_010791 [Apiospora hydei]|uniref:Uncharacterized protein n=1 Tax=Apiospora hydei TaxID=1337664 RepID=A0ABR1VH70_9PEZI